MACQLVLLTSTSASLFRSMASLSILPSLITPQQLSACWTCSDVVSELSVVLATEKHEGVDRTNKSNNSSSYRDIKRPLPPSVQLVSLQCNFSLITSRQKNLLISPGGVVFSTVASQKEGSGLEATSWGPSVLSSHVLPVSVWVPCGCYWLHTHKYECDVRN